MDVVYRPEQISPVLLSQPNTVIHLHGSLREPATMIMTTSDYINQYAAYNRSSHDPKTENPILTFLDFLLRHRTVLFVGYGLEELEVLEYVLTKEPHGRGEVRHYMLQGYFSHEETLVRNMDIYYRCGLAAYVTAIHERDHRLLLAVAPHVGVDYRVYEFLSELLRLAEQNEAAIVDVVDAMIKAHTPEYDYEDRLQKLLRTLVAKGKKRGITHSRPIAGNAPLYNKLTQARV